MKSISVILAIVLSASLSAAQCAGFAQKGERCKREAAADSAYCIGHADQTKVEKLKDDGTCWALTLKDVRCKNKKDGESDYCKTHAVKKLEKTPEKCRALTYEGNQCTRKPLDGYNYCKQHCGKM